MRISVLILMMISSQPSSAALRILLDQGPPVDIFQPLRITCQGITADAVPEITCGDSGGGNEFRCPAVSVDGTYYDVTGDITVFDNLYQVPAEAVTNCRRESTGAPPTFGAGRTLFMGTGIMQVIDFRLDVDSYTVQLTTADGDVICDGSVLPDDLFEDSFE